jgi:hypothetical protein
VEIFVAIKMKLGLLREFSHENNLKILLRRPGTRLKLKTDRMSLHIGPGVQMSVIWLPPVFHLIKRVGHENLRCSLNKM